MTQLRDAHHSSLSQLEKNVDEFKARIESLEIENRQKMEQINQLLMEKTDLQNQHLAVKDTLLQSERVNG